MNDILDLTYYPGQDYYCDGEIEDRLLELARSGREMEEILRENHEWPILYHLSDIREHVLDWYDFNPEGTLLEIGAGCGAVTGLFCRKVKQVLAVDLSKKRSTINAVRNGGRGNLKIMVGNFEDIVITEKFDYVTLIGVLEYSASYISKGENPNLEMLKRARGFLKPGGKLLIAIENKQGMKYFAGAGEDHTGRPFDGIEGYRGVSNVYTFSRPEIERLLIEAGFADNRFYYPMPDYKLPSVVYSDAHLPTPGDFVREVECYDRPRYAFFDENAAYSQVIRDGMFPYFANSFLIVAGDQPKNAAKTEDVPKTDFVAAYAENTGGACPTIYAKYNKLRERKFRVRTDICEENGLRRVEKYALCPEALPHVEGMADRLVTLRSVYPRLKFVDAEKIDGGVRFVYLHGESADRQIAKAAKDKASLINGFEVAFERILPGADHRSCFEETAAFDAVFGNGAGLVGRQAVTTANIDCILENIVVDGDDWICLDYEWVFDFAVPVDFMRYRVVHYFYKEYPETEKILSEEALLNEFGIGASDADRFAVMEQSFQKYVFGGERDCRYTENYRQPVTTYDQMVERDRMKSHEIDELRKVVGHYQGVEQKLRKIGLWQTLQGAQKVGRKVKGVLKR